MKHCLYIIACISFILPISCSKEQAFVQEKSEETSTGMVTEAQASARLEAFLNKAYPMTKAANKRRIASISTHYIRHIATKSDSCVVDSIPVYAVNFEDEQGFAILGAEEPMPDIMVVTESGSIDPESLTVLFDNITDMSESEIETDEFGDEIIEDEMMDIPIFSQEDGDFYCRSGSFQSNSAFIDQLIDNGISHLRTYDLSLIEMYEGGCTPWDGGGGGDGSWSDWLYNNVTTVDYVDRLPLLSYSWDQEEPYNKYCYRTTTFTWERIHALTGCSNTALAMIMAYNEFPTQLVLNGKEISWSGLKGNSHPDTPDSKEDVARLCGAIFNTTSHISGHIVYAFTLMTPEAIKNTMQDFQYENVEKHSGNSFYRYLRYEIDDMLRAYKPVFISALPPYDPFEIITTFDIPSGHSWVIDGGMHTQDGEYLLHCNWGWSGRCNGYFNIRCFDPNNGEIYDPDVPQYSNSSDEYTWHFRVISYDIPQQPLYYALNYSY